MTDPILIDQLATEVWGLYTADTENAETSIEAYLQRKFSHLPDSDKLKILEKLVDEFEGVAAEKPVELRLDEDLMGQISSLLLGREVLQPDISSEELGRRLSESLNTIFDALNQLIGVINRTLWGSGDDDRTIRQVIGSHLSGADSSSSLETHLGQINKAFLTVQRAFKETARDQVARILTELDPERIAREHPRGIKLGAFRKAACYDIYKERFGRIKRWFDSDKFMEDFLREFEKKCQDLAEN